MDNKTAMALRLPGDAVVFQGLVWEVTRRYQTTSSDDVYFILTRWGDRKNAVRARDCQVYGEVSDIAAARSTPVHRFPAHDGIGAVKVTRFTDHADVMVTVDTGETGLTVQVDPFVREQLAGFLSEETPVRPPIFPPNKPKEPNWECIARTMIAILKREPASAFQAAEVQRRFNAARELRVEFVDDIAAVEAWDAYVAEHGV